MKNAKLFKTILCLVMVLALLVACAPAAEESNNPGDKNDPAQYEGLEKEEYLQKLYENDLGAAIDSIGDVYGQILGGMSSGNAASAAAGGKTDMTLTLGEDLRDMLEQAIFGGDIGDMSFLSKINLGMDVGMSGDTQKMQMTLGLNGQQIVTLNMLMKMADSIMYVAAPELNDGWLKFDMGEMMPAGSASGMMNSAATMTALADALPDAETLTKVLDRYLNLVLPELDNVEQTSAAVDAGGLRQECTALTLKIYEADALAIAKAVLNTAKDDADLKKIIEDVAKAVEDMAGEDIGADGAYIDFKEGITDALDELNSITETDTEDPITLVTYVDKNHNVIGMKLSMPGYGNRGMAYYYTITQGDKTGFDMGVLDSQTTDEYDFRISGSGFKRDGKDHGDYTLTIEGKEYISVAIRDMDVESGTLTLTPTETMVYDLGLNALPFKNLAVQVKLGGDGMELNVLSENKLLAGLALKAIQSAGPNLSEPSNATDAMDSAAMQSWAEKLDLTKVLDNLEKAGVPSALIEGIINGLSGGATAQPESDYSYAA